MEKNNTFSVNFKLLKPDKVCRLDNIPILFYNLCELSINKIKARWGEFKIPKTI